MTAKLLIRKRMVNVQGKVRPACFVQAIVEPAAQAALETHFSTETLFRRAAYSQSWPEGTIKIPASIAPSLATFLKNDACPEIAVKTLLAGQSYQGANAWEMMSFELIAKVAFDNLLELSRTALELDRDVDYFGSAAGNDLPAFEADAASDALASQSSVAAA
ncbi:MAG: hypothetical protein WC026_15335 [Hyphomicrobium sp.]|uniref:hypothetical protein n=1 Tax=Hyphomicrobium sp. TaxID=82 RepID=UPI00356132F5